MAPICFSDMLFCVKKLPGGGGGANSKSLLKPPSFHEVGNYGIYYKATCIGLPLKIFVICCYLCINNSR